MKQKRKWKYSLAFRKPRCIYACEKPRVKLPSSGLASYFFSSPLFPSFQHICLLRTLQTGEYGERNMWLSQESKVFISNFPPAQVGKYNKSFYFLEIQLPHNTAPNMLALHRVERGTRQNGGVFFPRPNANFLMRLAGCEYMNVWPRQDAEMGESRL